MNALEITSQYFRDSNQSDFTLIENYFRESSSYSSQHTGLYLGRDDIITMQKNFHSSFVSLKWEIQDMKEEKPGIVRVDFEFIGTKKSGETLHFEGIEYVVIFDSKIQHIEIRSK